MAAAGRPAGARRARWIRPEVLSLLLLSLLLLATLAGRPRILAAQAAPSPSPEAEKALAARPEPPRAEGASRSGVPPPAPEVRVWRTGGIKVETAGLLLSGQQGGDLPMAVLAAPLPDEVGVAGPGRIALRVEIPGRALLGAAGRPAAPAASPRPPAAAPRTAPNETARLRLDVAVYSLGTSGQLEGSIADTVELDLSTLARDLRETGVAFSAVLRLPAGEHSLRVLVRQPESGAMGLRIASLTQPAAADDSPRLLTPQFPPPAGNAAWVEARGAGASPAEPCAPRSARPVLGLDQESSFELPALHLAAEGPALRVELRAAGGAAVELAGRLAPLAGSDHGVVRFAASFVPRGVPPGAYELRAVVVAGRDAGGGELRVRSPALPVVVARGAAGAVWAEIEQAGPEQGQGQAAAAGAGPAGAPAPRSGGRLRGAAGPLAASFRRALAGLAAGEVDAARDRVAALERTLLREDQSTLDEVAAFENDALAPLAAANPEALIPVLRLYELLYLSAREGRANDLAAHAQGMFFALARRYLKSSRAEAARPIAARLLTMFAGDLERQGGAEAAAERALRQAALLDPRYETPRICLAVLAERRGDYRSEIALLEPLVRDRPDHGEPRLRLALALERSGQERAARRQLEELLRAAAPDWTLAVGCQELAKLLLAEHEAAAAEAIVRQALGRSPGDEKLSLLLGLVLDAGGRRGAAREAVAAIGLASAAGAPGREAEATAEEPRHRYTELPSEQLRQDAAGAAAWIGERLASLAAALEVSRAGGG
jgi:hypothetical protein